jgi:hypothetical protein
MRFLEKLLGLNKRKAEIQTVKSGVSKKTDEVLKQYEKINKLIDSQDNISRLIAQGAGVIKYDTRRSYK